jgi:2-methylcitrate dehydratase
VVLKLPQRAMVQAVNLAGVANIALRQTRVGDLSMWKACAFSNAARNGVFAATLAQAGMTGPSPIFEGEKGFIKLVSGPLELPAFGGEGTNSFKILDTYIKHYPVEYHAQTAVEAALLVRKQLLREYGGDGNKALDAITDIEIGSYDVAIEIIGRDPEKWRPRTRETADHSFPYCVAVALKEGDITLKSFSTKRLADLQLHDLMSKVRVVAPEEFRGSYPAAMPTRLTVRTSTRQFAQQVEHPLGHPKNPMSDRDVEQKFWTLSAARLGRARAQQLIQMVWRLEKLDDIGRLMPLIRVTKNG